MSGTAPRSGSTPPDAAQKSAMPAATSMNWASNAARPVTASGGPEHSLTASLSSFSSSGPASSAVPTFDHARNAFAPAWPQLSA